MSPFLKNFFTKLLIQTTFRRKFSEMSSQRQFQLPEIETKHLMQMNYIKTKYFISENVIFVSCLTLAIYEKLNEHENLLIYSTPCNNASLKYMLNASIIIFKGILIFYIYLAYIYDSTILQQYQQYVILQYYTYIYCQNTYIIL